MLNCDGLPVMVHFLHMPDPRAQFAACFPCVGVLGMSLGSCWAPRVVHCVPGLNIWFTSPWKKLQKIPLSLSMSPSLFLFSSPHNVTLIIQPCVTAWQSRKISASLCACCLLSCAGRTCPASFLLRVCRNKVIKLTKGSPRLKSAAHTSRFCLCLCGWIC